VKNSRTVAALATVLGIAVLTSDSSMRAQAAGPLFIGLGDSIGEAVQSGDANTKTQANSFIHIISLLAGAPVPLPYIQGGLTTSVDSVNGRSRLVPGTMGLNLAVSGADLNSLLTDRADAGSTAEINSETDMVLFPRLGSQIEIAEALQPQLIACWIGNNDALSAVLDYDQLDGFSQLTPLDTFTSQFQQIAARLSATGAKVVFGTIPDVTKIAYLVNPQDLLRLTGSTHGLAAGSYTTLVVTAGIKLGSVDPVVLTNPNFVLDAAEVANINQRISDFNNVIRTTAAAYGQAVADTAALFDYVAATPPVLFGVPLTTRFLGGMFSLDGVHPSNIGQLIVAKFFIETFNQRFGLSIPNVNIKMVSGFFMNDPFVDKDGDGRVTGRFGAGLLETVGALIGWSGDTNDQLPSPDLQNSRAAVETMERELGVDLQHATQAERLDAVARMFGIKRR
jgi:hypothetical protein